MNKQEFKEMLETLHMLAHILIQNGQEEKNHSKWFLGNALGTILIASENQEDIEMLSKVFQKFCDNKRKEAGELEDLAKTLENMPTREIPGIADLLNGTGICLN